MCFWRRDFGAYHESTEIESGGFLHLNAMILGRFRPSEIGILLQTYAVLGALCVFLGENSRAKGCRLLQIKRILWEETSKYLGCDDSCFGPSFC